MLFEFGRYSSLLLLFFVHGLVYALLLWRRSQKEERRADGWLALFLVLCVLYITPWMTGFAGWYDTQPYRDFLFYFPFQQLLLLGPVVYCYVQAVLNPAFRLHRRNLHHFLLPLLYNVYIIGVWITDKVVLKRYFFLASGSDPDFELWYQLLGFLSMTAYLLLSLRYYRVYRKVAVQVVAYADRIRYSWVRHFLLAFLTMLLLRLLMYAVSLLGFDDYSDSWWYYLFFSVVFYYIAIRGYGSPADAPIAFHAKGEGGVVLSEAEGEASIALDAPGAEPAAAPDAWTEERAIISRAMEEERWYEEEDLSLPGMAARLGMPPSTLSRIINGGFGCNFNDFVNRYRVYAVQRAISEGRHQTKTLLGLALEAGFNSKATFNRAFLKVTGVAPSSYIRTLDSDSNAAG